MTDKVREWAHYTSAKTGMPKQLSEELCLALEEWVNAAELGSHSTYRQVQDRLLDFKNSDGKGLTMNQLYPLFMHICLNKDKQVRL